MAPGASDPTPPRALTTKSGTLSSHMDWWCPPQRHVTNQFLAESKARLVISLGRARSKETWQQKEKERAKAYGKSMVRYNSV